MNQTQSPAHSVYLKKIASAILSVPVLWAWGSLAHADEINMSAIAFIESSNRPHICSYLGCQYGRGLYQISEIVLKEYNQFRKTDYKPDDLFNPAVNTKIACWYLTERIPSMLRAYNHPVTLHNILWAYNAGIGNLVKNRLPDETKAYIRKYERLDGIH